MHQVQEVSSDLLKISSDISLNSVKQESDNLVQSEIHMKTEPQEVENEFPIIASMSYNMCFNYDMKIKTKEPMIKIECEDLLDELIQDPLGVGNESKAKISASSSDEETSNKPERTKEEHHLTSEDKELHERTISKSNQDLLFIRNKKGRKAKQHICSMCNKTFGNKSNFNRHLLTHSANKLLNCDICKKLFVTKGSLDTHMLIHSGKKPHVCDVCHKMFSKKSILNKHKFFHSGKKPFSCDDCHKPFAQKSSLVVHKRMHTGDKPYTCDLCKKRFSVKSNLNQHRRLHTGEKPYSCDICNNSFMNNSHLNRHRKIHKN